MTKILFLVIIIFSWYGALTVQLIVQINLYFPKSYVSFFKGYIEEILAYKYLNSAFCHFELPKQRNIAKWKFAAMFLF